MLEVVPFTYDEVKADLTDRFVAKGYDANVEGSNAAILSGILSYAISMLNTNIAFNTSEMLLSSATKEDNILSIARQMGYEAQNKVSYTYRITLQAKLDTTRDPQSVFANLYELPKYSSFTSGSYTYYYMGETIRRYVCNKDITDGTDTSYFTIYVKEGVLKLADDFADTLITTTTTVLDSSGEIQTQNFVDIPLTSVEDDGIQLFLTYIDEYGIEHIEEPWTKSTQFLIDKDTNLEKQFMRLQDLTTKTPKCYFALAGIGNELRLNTVIKANVLVSNGTLGVASGNMELGSSLSSTFALYDGTNADRNQTLMASGQEEEGTDSIKENAPLFHNSANRAVVKGDYIAISNRQSVVQQTQVWGGDEELPVTLGNVFLSIIPSYKDKSFTIDSLKNNFNLSSLSDPSLIFIKDTEIRSENYDTYGNLTDLGVFDVLDEFKIMTMHLNHRHPVYMNFDYSINVVSYNLKNTKQQVNQDTFDLINTYFIENIELFESQYFHSNLIKRVDTELTDLTGVNITVSNTVSIYKKNIISEREVDGENQLIIFLATPFESYTNSTDGTLINGILPEIRTEGFIAPGDLLEVDWTSPSINQEMDDADHFSFPIKYNGVICGKYYVQNRIRKHIRIDLWLNDNGAANTNYTTSLLNSSMFNSEKRMNVSYKTPNFKIYKNTVPRLTSIVFE